MSGPGEGWVGLGRKGSGWAQFGPTGSREVAFGRGLGMMEGSHFCYVLMPFCLDVRVV